jgi:hypothetical protein
MKNPLLLAVFIALTTSSLSFADESSYCGEAGLGGISVDGEKQRMISVYYQTVRFPDRSGIRKAVIIAEERAKGEMVRFFSQNQDTMRTVEETDAESEEATRLVDENGSVMNRSITRAQSAVLTQVDASIASGDLSGIMKIEESYDRDAEEVCVAMGYSAKSNAMAQQAQDWMNNPGAAGASTSDRSGASEIGSYSKKRKGDW